MNPWHLLWIIPVSMVLGQALLILVFAFIMSFLDD